MGILKTEFEKRVNEAIEFLKITPKSEVFRDEALQYLENLLYNNIVSNFERNLTIENRMEYSITESEYRRYKQELAPIRNKVRKNVEASKRIIRSDEYKTFSKKVRKVSKGLSKMLNEIERRLDLNHCEKQLEMFRSVSLSLGIDIEGGEVFVWSIIEEAVRLGVDIEEIDFEKYYEYYIDEEMPIFVEKLSDEFRGILRKDVKKWRRLYRKYNKKTDKIWGSAFDYLEMIHYFCYNLGSEFNEKHRNKISDDDYLFEALVNLHARACQISLEIITLLKNGFAEGSQARWRSLHEVTVTAMFLKEVGGNVAERYLDYGIIENYQEAKTYQETCSKMGFEPLPTDSWEEVERGYLEINTKHGKQFKQKFGWIPDGILSNKSFREMEEYIDLDKYRSYYKLACNYVHAGPKGIQYRMGLDNENIHDELLLAGPSYFGLADPGQLCALSMFYITVTLLSSKPAFEHVPIVHVLSNLLEDTQSAFMDVHSSLETDS